LPTTWEEISAAVETIAWLVAILTFPVFCVATLRQSDAQEMDLIAAYRSRLDEAQRRYRKVASQETAATATYDEAAVDLLSVFEDLAFFINKNFALARAKRYLSAELSADLGYLLSDERFQSVFARNLTYPHSLIELARFMQKRRGDFKPPRQALES
jgi:hypothetical protein